MNVDMREIRKQRRLARQNQNTEVEVEAMLEAMNNGDEGKGTVEKTAKQRRLEQREEQEEKATAIRNRIWWLLRTSPKVDKFADFAKDVLEISPSSLSRKLTGKDRYFNQFEIEACIEFFGEKAMDTENYEITDTGRIVPKLSKEM